MSQYIAFYKPYGVLSQFTAEEGQRTLSEFGLPKDVYAAGRLDKDSEGLLILSDDGAFINKVADPKFSKIKTYWVQVEKIPTQDDLDKLKKGVLIKDYKTKPCEVRILEEPSLEPRDPPIRERKAIPTCWLELKITEGKNRQVRRMTAAIGFPTLRLLRVSVGKYFLGQLTPGQWTQVESNAIV